MSQLLTKYQSDYSGGLNDTAAPSEIRDNEASVLRNWDITFEGRLVRRPGISLAGSAISTNPITGLGAFIRNSGQDLLAIESTNLYYLNGASFTKIANNLTAGNLFWMENIQTFGQIAIANEDNFVVWDRAGTTLNSCLTDKSALPHGNVFRWHKNFLFTLNNVNVTGTKYRNRLYWSPLGDPFGVWDTTNDWFEIPGDGGAVSMIDLGDNLVLFKERAIQFLSGWGDDSWRITASTSNVANISESVGIAGARAVCRVGNEAWFVDDEVQIRRLTRTDFDAFRTDIISTKLQTTLAAVNKSQASKALAWSNGEKVYFAFPVSTNTYNTLLCVFDIIAAKRTGQEAWTTYTGWSPNLFVDYPTSTTPDLYFADAVTGKIHKVDPTALDDEGTAIDARWDGKQDFFKKPERWKRYSYGYARGSSTSGETSFDIHASVDSAPFAKLKTIALEGSGSRLGPTGSFLLGPTGGATLGGATQAEDLYEFTEGGGSPMGKSLQMSIRHSVAGQRPTVGTFSNHYKERQLR